MKNKLLRNFLQNVALVLLTASALFLLTRMPMMRNIRLSDQVQTLFAPPAAGVVVEGSLPAAMFPSVSLMVTGDSEYGRCGQLCVAADDASLQDILPLFQEALGSAVPGGEADHDAFRKALDGAGLCLEFTGGSLPLEGLAAWLGEEAGFAMRVRSMVLAAGEEDAAALYLLDGNGSVFLFATALPVSAVRALCERFTPNGAQFAYETEHTSLPPYTVLTVEAAVLPEIQAELPAGYSAYNLLTALDFNAHTLSRYVESGGAEVVEESPRTLRISPDGLVSFTGRAENAPSLYRASGTGLREALSAAWRLSVALTEGTGASPLHLQGVEEQENGYTLRFRYEMDGVPVCFSDKTDALTVVVQNGCITAFTYRCRVYAALEEEPAAMLPAAMAQAIAAVYPGAALSVGYADDGSGRLSAQWLR